MSELPSDRPQPVRTTASTPPNAAGADIQAGATATIRTAARRSCPRCGAVAPAHANICPTCGENLMAKPSVIRCRRCGSAANSELVICPHCGRELVAAPSRLLTVGAPVLLAGLFLFVVVTQWDRADPVSWMRDRLRGLTSAAGEPAAIVIMTPVPPEESGGPDAVAESAFVPAVEAAAAVTTTAAQESALAVSAADAVPVATTASMPVTLTTELPAPTAVAVLSSTAPQTATLTSGTGGKSMTNLTEAAQAASESLPTAASTLANAFVLPTDTPIATPAPTSTPTSVPTATPTATLLLPTPVPLPTYAIRRGDTLVVIASRYDVAVDDLMRLNNISPSDAFAIQPGDILLIPLGEQIPYPTATPTLTPTPPPAATRAPTPMPVAMATAELAQAEIRLDAPVLLSPESGTPVSCAAPTALVWQGVPFVRADDRYLMHLGFVSGRTADNQDIVTWVLAQPRPANATSWDMDGNLCGLASHEFGRQWRWWVEVVTEVGGQWSPVSPPSAIWSFSWN